MKTVDLTEGSILKKLLIMSVPIILTNLINMAYNFTDLFWIGLSNEEEIASVGTAGLYIWLFFGVVLLSNCGTQILVAQNVGKKNIDEVKNVALNSIKFTFITSTSYMIIIMIFSGVLIDVFGIQSVYLSKVAKDYLFYFSLSLPFMGLVQVMSGIFNGMGNSKLVFIYSSIGLVLNMILDPIFIFWFGLGAIGAACASVVSTIVAFSLFYVTFKRQTDILSNFSFKIDLVYIKKILKLGTMPAIQSVIFSFLGMLINYYALKFGDKAGSVLRIGNQVESFSWMISQGIMTAICVFVAQNVAAKKYKRVCRGVAITTIFMSVYGLFVTLLFLLCGSQIYEIFFDKKDTIEMGKTYLQIVALCQLFMIFEGLSTGVLNGLGKTTIPAAISVAGNLLRIPLVISLSMLIGLNGVWYTTTISALIKGLCVTTFLLIWFGKNKDYKFKYFFKSEEIT